MREFEYAMVFRCIVEGHATNKDGDTWDYVIQVPVAARNLSAAEALAIKHVKNSVENGDLEDVGCVAVERIADRLVCDHDLFRALDGDDEGPYDICQSTPLQICPHDLEAAFSDGPIRCDYDEDEDQPLEVSDLLEDEFEEEFGDLDDFDPSEIDMSELDE